MIDLREKISTKQEFTLKTSSLSKGGRRLAKAAMCILSDFLEDRDLLNELDLALTEACANVVRHAYPEGKGDLQINLTINPGDSVVFEIFDWGCGLDTGKIDFGPPDPEAEGGRGFFLMKKLSDEFDIQSSYGKSVVSLKKIIGEHQWRI